MNKLRDFTATPSDLALLEFFESEPLDSEPQDGYWCYQYVDEKEIGVRLSYNILEKSVQTTLLCNGEETDTVVHEGAEELYIVDQVLHGKFDLGQDTRLVLQLKPRILIRWSTLRKY